MDMIIYSILKYMKVIEFSQLSSQSDNHAVTFCCQSKLPLDGLLYGAKELHFP